MQISSILGIPHLWKHHINVLKSNVVLAEKRPLLCWEAWRGEESSKTQGAIFSRSSRGTTRSFKTIPIYYAQLPVKQHMMQGMCRGWWGRLKKIRDLCQNAAAIYFILYLNCMWKSYCWLAPERFILKLHQIQLNPTFLVQGWIFSNESQIPSICRSYYL